MTEDEVKVLNSIKDELYELKYNHNHTTCIDIMAMIANNIESFKETCFESLDGFNNYCEPVGGNQVSKISPDVQCVLDMCYSYRYGINELERFNTRVKKYREYNLISEEFYELECVEFIKTSTETLNYLYNDKVDKLKEAFGANTVNIGINTFNQTK